MKRQYRDYRTGQKRFTKAQRHRIIVRREKNCKQRNVSQAGRMFRLQALRLKRAHGVWKRALQFRKINDIKKRLRISMGALQYQEYANKIKDPRNAAFRGQEPIINWEE